MADDIHESQIGHDMTQGPSQSSPTAPAPFGSTNNAPSILPRSQSNLPQLIPPSATNSSKPTATLDSHSAITNSASSFVPPAQTTNAMDTSGPSPYGTRSRNRNGNTRPNYAEDRELDMDYDLGTGKKAKGLSGSASSNNLDAGETTQGSAVNTRRSSTAGSGAGTGKPSATTTMPKDYIPGMSSFSLNPDVSPAPQPPSKKRKAPGGGPTASSSSLDMAQVTPYVPPRRKNSTAAMARTRETNMLSFENCQGYLKNGKLKADDGTLLAPNDHVYLICEPPGEPYYLARIMEFLHAENDDSLPIDSFRVNWYYRPRDIVRKVNDTRVVFASMHSDTCPLTSLRGKCRIVHRSEIDDLDEYRKTKDSFWFEKLYERWMQRFYEVIPTSQVINVPDKVKNVLDERWKYVIVEMGRGKELTSAIKSCKRCGGYCATNDSVDCAMCKNTYHMNCVRPALLKKPARGFAWSCGPCSRKQERKLEARNTPLVGDKTVDGEEEEFLDEEEEEHGGGSNLTTGSNPDDPNMQNSGPRPATAEQTAQAKLWPYRYFGIHCSVEDALDYDDRIYPRASSRLGPKHQANVHIWHGRPVEFVKPAEVRRKYVKGGSHKKDAKLTKETVAALEEDKATREKRPKWVMDEPSGYVRRGEDHPNSDPLNTAKLKFRLPEVGEVSSRGGDDASDTNISIEDREKIVDDYMARARSLAKFVGVKEYSTNFLDKALELLCINHYQVEPALVQLRSVNRRKDLKEPELNKEELKRFEEGVSKFGSERRSISKHVGKSQKHGEIVRFYYMWKKTERGKQIWGHFEGRKGKKQTQEVDLKLVDDVADDIDDSAFDNEKAAARKRGFECKFCSSRSSPQWRRAPGTAPGTTVPVDQTSKSSKDKGAYLMLALCQRCAGLWRKYGIQWENLDEVAKKVANGGGRAWKRRIDEELLAELVNTNKINSISISSAAAATAASVGVEVPTGLTIPPGGQEGSKKKQKTGFENQTPQGIQNGSYIEPPKKKVTEKPPEPPLIPEPPRIRALPCAVCYEMEPSGEERFCCKHCRLTVHRNCYGIGEGRLNSKWTCDMCSNDSVPTNQISTSYECVVCPVRLTEQELMEPPKVSHKKKNDREREKERLEREMVIEHTARYHRVHEDKGWPVDPREPLKRTTGNNWIHVNCAVWIPEIRFGNAKLLDTAENIGTIPAHKWEKVCKLCKSAAGVCVNCHHCQATFHVGCAQQYRYWFGFDVTPVKASRIHTINTVTLGSETGHLSAVIYCSDHNIKNVLHPIHEMVKDSPLNALQLFVRTYKQADLALTGTVRKAAINDTATRGALQSTSTSTGHRGSTSGPSASAPITRSSRVSPAAVTVKSEEVDEDGDRVVHLSDTIVIEPSLKECAACGADASPKWHKIIPNVGEGVRSLPVTTNVAESTGSQVVLQNGYTNGDSSNFQDDSGARPGASGTPEIIGDGSRNSEPPSEVVVVQDNATTAPAITAEPETASTAAAPVVPEFLCHKCHLRKLRDPTPRPSVSPKPDVILLNSHEVDGLHTPSPRLHSVWPPIPAMQNNEQYHGWPDRPRPGPYNAQPHLPNGISHSPPVGPLPLQSHFAPPAPYRAPAYGHPPHHELPIQHQLNGAPSPFQLQHNSTGHLVTVPYAQHPPRVQHVRPPPSIMRSPPMPDHSLGPHGPPGAAENPFAVRYQSHPSPRQQYHGAIYGSPRGNHERPETPPEGIGRTGGWPNNDGRLTNGASESPSLRNLLH